MSYTPTPREVRTFTDLQDVVDDVEVATVRPWLEELSDHSEWFKAGGEFAAANWFAGGSTTNGMRRVVYSPTDAAWIGVGSGGNDFLETSIDWGVTWTDRSGALGTSKVLADVTVLGDGSIVAVTGSRDVVKGTRTGYDTFTWAATANALNAAPSAVSVDYEATAALAAAVYRVGATGMRIDTSSDGVLFGGVTLPASWTGYTGTSNPEVGARPGHTIALFADGSSAGIVRVVTSSDGSTFTEVTINLATIAAADIVAGHRITRPTYDPITGKWFFGISCTASNLSEIWASSDDGATWAHVVTFAGATDVEVQAAAVVGPAWCFVTSKGRVMRSTDAGATWRWVGAVRGNAANFTLRGDGEGSSAIVVNNSGKTVSRAGRFGDPGVSP